MKVPTSTIRLPYVSERGPQNDGARPCTTIYTVMVRPMSEMLTLRSCNVSKKSSPGRMVSPTLEIWTNAGRYMLLESGEKSPAKLTM